MPIRSALQRNWLQSNLFSVLRDDGYPVDFINKYKCVSTVEPTIGPKCKDVFIRLPFVGVSLSGLIRLRVLVLLNKYIHRVILFSLIILCAFLFVL